MERFKENKTATVSGYIMVIFMAIGIVSAIITLILSCFINSINPALSVVFLFGFCILAMIPSGIHSMKSGCDKYTREFLSYMENKYKTCTTKSDLEDLLSEFESLALTENRKSYNLSFPVDLRVFHHRLINQIEALNKFKN